MKRFATNSMAGLALATAGLIATAAAQGQSFVTDATPAAETRYNFLVFYKNRGSATQKMAQAVKRNLAARTDEAKITFVDATNPNQRWLVDRYKVARSPMPLTMAVAPNGAITGMFAGKVSDRQIADAFVTPNMARCMKSMQDGRLVFVCVSTTPQPALPQGVRDFQADPQFKGRSDVVALQADDPNEVAFLQQLKIDPQAVHGTTTAFLAPPAVLIGKYGPAATKNEMAAALHAAGKCCNDPHCKHNHAH